MEKNAYLKKPEMIFFDVGGTLFIDGKCIFRDGLSALRSFALNPEVTDDDTMCRLLDEYLEEVDTGHRSKSGAAMDIHLSSMLKYVIFNTGLRFREDMIQLEEIFDRFNSTRLVAEGTESLLDTIRRKNIRTAVISNNAMSGEGLSLAIKRWLPSASFEFCLTSADILLAKPCSSLFLAAANYAGVATEACWYCGDGRIPDVDGAKNSGMLPVLIDNTSDIPLGYRADGGRGGYMAINNWRELEKFINDIKD